MNALNLSMIRAFRAALEVFVADAAIRSVAVLSTRAGAFCAGGDVRLIRQQRLEGHHAQADAFFEEEYSLNARIAAFPKPYVAFVNGLCFGGGMGLSVHGAHRIAGPLAEFSMPETAIGFFPDIGASYFLNRLPGAIGCYLALTGTRASPADALYAGLATAVVDEPALGRIQAALADGAGPEEAVAPHRGGCGSSFLARHREAVDRCFGQSSLDAIFRALETESTDFASRAAASLRAASPTSLQITLDLLQRTRTASLAKCLEIEYTLAREVTRGPDFSEGVRAMLVDKDRSPVWPASARLRREA